MRNIGLRTATHSGDATPYSSEAPAIRTLERKGFAEPFSVTGDSLVLSGGGRKFRPEELRLKDYFRFEGTSDPDDMSIIYALEAMDGTRGYLVNAFGVYADPSVNDLVRRIPREFSPESGSSPWRRIAFFAGALIVLVVALSWRRRG